MSSRVSIPLVVLWPPETFPHLLSVLRCSFLSEMPTQLHHVCMCPYILYIFSYGDTYVITTNITVKDHHHSFTDTPTLLSRLSAVLNENSIHENTTCIEFSTYKEINYFADVSIVLTMYNKPFSCILHDLYFFEKLNIDAPVIFLLKNYNLKSHV